MNDKELLEIWNNCRKREDEANEAYHLVRKGIKADLPRHK